MLGLPPRAWSRTDSARPQNKTKSTKSFLSPSVRPSVLSVPVPRSYTAKNSLRVQYYEALHRDPSLGGARGTTYAKWYREQTRLPPPPDLTKLTPQERCDERNVLPPHSRVAKESVSRKKKVKLVMRKGKPRPHASSDRTGLPLGQQGLPPTGGHWLGRAARTRSRSFFLNGTRARCTRREESRQSPAIRNPPA